MVGEDKKVSRHFFAKKMANEDAPVFISLRRGKPFHSACEEVSLRCP